jgi:hypothetical protein
VGIPLMEEKNKITTIKLEKATKARLDKLKEHEKESYNQVLKKILYILNLVRKNPSSGNKSLIEIDQNIKKRKALNWAD